MSDIPKIGVFLCKCGQKIEPLVDLSVIKKNLDANSEVTCCEVMPYPCLEPGLKDVIKKIREKELNRVVVAGCESRLMLKKFETRLKPEGFNKGQVDIVNLRDHVASVSNLSSEQNAEKGTKLIRAAVDELASFVPIPQTKIRIDNPPIIVGGGIASYSAALELSKQGLDCLLFLPEENSEVIQKIYKKFPGEQSNYDRLNKIIKEVLNEPHIKIIPYGDLVELTGITGEYTLSFAVPEETARRQHKAGSVIACVDNELFPPDSKFGYDGKTVLCQTDFEGLLLNEGLQTGQTVFWINDYEAGQPESAQLSARSAWALAKQIMETTKNAKATILYNEQMPLQLSAAERALGRRLGLNWIPYDKSVQPILQTGYITFGGLDDHLEQELYWDRIVLSPVRKTDGNALQTAKIIGLVHDENEAFDIHRVKVRPEMVGRAGTFLVGSASYPCNLSDALNQGKTAGKMNAEMIKKSWEEKLCVPGIVSVIDPDKCIGCGQCQQLCDCNAISIIEGTGGGLPRVVDPLLCTGGGTCAAACPYQAITMQNNTNEQQEIRAGSLARQMADDEAVVFACSWAGLPAADNAGTNGLKYDQRIHIIGMPCLGQIDPSVMAKVFLEGAPGLLLVGCSPEACHHSFGVDHAWSRVNFLKKLFSLCGFDRRRIVLAHADMNQPEEFIRTVENFTKTIAELGPLEKNSENQSKLRSIYRLVKYNSRIRLLLSSGLRRPWETTYRGDQQYALEYDRSDFSNALKEEFLKARLEEMFMAEKRPFEIEELAAISEEKHCVIAQLNEMVSEGSINLTYKNGKPSYINGK